MQKYFRRFTTNYRNTVDFPNYELYMNHLKEVELQGIHQEVISQETSDTNKKHEVIFQDPEELINAKRSYEQCILLKLVLLSSLRK